MLITLVTEARHERAPVVVTGAGFEGPAIWLGQAERAGAHVDVELQIRDEVDWEDVVVADSDGVGVISRDDADVVLRGVVDDLDKDGVLTLRLVDGVVLIDTRGEPPLGVVGRTVRILVRDVEVVPTGV